MLPNACIASDHVPLLAVLRLHDRPREPTGAGRVLQEPVAAPELGDLRDRDTDVHASMLTDKPVHGLLRKPWVMTNLPVLGTEGVKGLG